MTDSRKPSGELVHYGVKGMKWGVRRAEQNAPNASYKKSQQRYDQQSYGKGSVKRINRRLNKGDDIKTARKKEANFQTGRALVVIGAGVAAHILANHGTMSATAAANRSYQRFGGPIHAKPNRKGVYKITDL